MTTTFYVFIRMHLVFIDNVSFSKVKRQYMGGVAPWPFQSDLKIPESNVFVKSFVRSNHTTENAAANIAS